MNTLGLLQTYFQNKSNDTSDEALALFKISVQAAIDDLTADTPFEYDKKTIERTTVASQSEYNLAVDHMKMNSVKVTVGGRAYFPLPLSSDKQWNDLLQGSTTATRDIPEYYRVKSGVLELFPIPSSAGNTIEIDYDARAPRYADADFTDKTAGTAAATLASAAVTGAGGTAFASSDVGRYIMLTSGDRHFYKIATAPTSASLTLSQVYEGASVSGSAYRIGTIPRIAVAHPEAMRVIAAYCLAELWEKREEFTALAGKSKKYQLDYEEGKKALREKIQDQYTDSDANYFEAKRGVMNPNDHPLTIN